MRFETRSRCWAGRGRGAATTPSATSARFVTAANPQRKDGGAAHAGLTAPLANVRESCGSCHGVDSEAFARPVRSLHFSAGTSPRAALCSISATNPHNGICQAGRLIRRTDRYCKVGVSPSPVEAHDIAAVAREPLAQPVGQQLRRRVPPRKRRGDDRTLHVTHGGGRVVTGVHIPREPSGF